MKKLLGIVVLGLLWSSVAQSETKEYPYLTPFAWSINTDRTEITITLENNHSHIELTRLIIFANCNKDVGEKRYITEVKFSDQIITYDEKKTLKVNLNSKLEGVHLCARLKWKSPKFIPFPPESSYSSGIGDMLRSILKVIM